MTHVFRPARTGAALTLAALSLMALTAPAQAFDITNMTEAERLSLIHI